MIFVPFSWSDYYGQGIQRVLCQKGDKMLCAMTSDGFDAGFSILEGVNEGICSEEDLGGAVCWVWDPSGTYGTEVSEVDANLEEGYCCDNVVNYPDEKFESAVHDLG